MRVVGGWAARIVPVRAARGLFGRIWHLIAPRATRAGSRFLPARAARLSAAHNDQYPNHGHRSHHWKAQEAPLARRHHGSWPWYQRCLRLVVRTL